MATIYIQFCVLLVMIFIMELRAEPFPCGHLSCDRLGYDFCLLPPYVADGEAECWSCSIKVETCGTADEEPGCNLYCQDIIISVYEKRIGGLNRKMVRLNESVAKLDAERMQEHDNYQTAAEQSTFYLILSITLAGVSVLLLVMLIYTWCRKRSNSSQDPESSPVMTFKDRKNGRQTSSAATSTAKFETEDEGMGSIDNCSNYTDDTESRRLTGKQESTDIDSRITLDQDKRNDTFDGEEDGAKAEGRKLLAEGKEDWTHDTSKCRDMALRQIQPENLEGQAKMAIN